METKTLQPDLKAIEKVLKDQKQKLARQMFHMATPEHNPMRKRGIGYTRKNKDQSKKARKASQLSRKINREK